MASNTYGFEALQHPRHYAEFYTTTMNTTGVINQINLRTMRFPPPTAGIIGKRAKT